ncbi:hypothetical protein C8R46DRAFT_62942 [Mycena filopes]|nr:hypothetical protein C8R46DRAFT_62942 [Mycena filopes]
MPDKENKRREWSAADADAAAAKLWEVYVTEAEKYDEGLVDSWKKDMEGLLIFAALFSAILTAFIIESYKSLSPDDTVQVLSQISQQLAAVAGGKPFDISLTPTFAPPVSSIVCNALWFISLGLSLACALIATLVQQWARDFLHKTQLRSAPGLRAPIFTYFYYGLKRFGMHRVVEVIPLLLHGSLALFFAGLLAFLIPVNTALAAITALILLIVGGLYVVFTLLPLQWLDCPYHTPLSATSWMGWTALQRTWLARRHRVQNKDAEFASTHPPHRDSIPLAGILTGPTPTAPALTEPAGSVPPHPRHDTMMKAMLHAAAENSEGRKVREYKALVWTMGSLADNSELEPFIQGIVNVLEEPHERRPAYEEHIRCLSRESDNHLLDRIANLLDSCTTALLSQEAVQRRRITCYKALWLIASLLTKPGEAVDFEYIYSRPSFHSEEHYCISARAIMAYSTLIAVEPQILQWSDSTWRQMSSKFYSRVVSHSWSYLTPARSVDALASISSNIYLDFVATAALSSSSPYRWAETRATLTKSHEAGHIKA